MSALFSLSATGGLFVVMVAAYVFADVVTGYGARQPDDWERDELGEPR